MRLLDTNAISMPEKNADNIIVTAILIKRGMSVSTIYKNNLSLFVFLYYRTAVRLCGVTCGLMAAFTVSGADVIVSPLPAMSVFSKEPRLLDTK